MKNLKKIFILCAAILLVSGCSMKSEYKMEISSDKSMKFSVTSAMDDELIEALLSMQNNPNIDTDSNCIDDETGMTNCGSSSDEEKEYTDEEKWNMLESSIEGDENPEDFGFTKTRYEKDKYKGFTYSIYISNIDKISSDTANFTFEDFKEISKKIVFVKKGNNYKANLSITSNEETEGYDIDADIKFIVTLPNKPTNHNATKVSEDGKTLTWDLADKDTQNIEFEFSLINPLLIYAIIGGAGLLIIIIILLIIIKRKKKKNQETNIENDEPIYYPEDGNNFTQNTINENPINSYGDINNAYLNNGYTNNFEQNNVNPQYNNQNIVNTNYQTPNVNFEQPIQNQEPEIIGEEFNVEPDTSSFINITNEQISNIYNEPIQNQSIINEVPNAYSEPTQNIINETPESPIPDIKTQVDNTYNPFNNNNLN